jgi:hypothetical protein
MINIGEQQVEDMAGNSNYGSIKSSLEQANN